ncbi:transposase [Serratia proteamaculans]|uniref:transposase n=1 Tax=Serratia proteamaculans TaxID=28151 RepID=UPI0036F27BCA
MAKQTFKITNWATYNKALIHRGSLTFWLDASAIQTWYDKPNTSSPGRPQRYSELTISTVLMLKRVFRLTPRAARRAGIYRLHFYPDEAPAQVPGLLLCQQAG